MISGTNGSAKTARAAALHYIRCGVYPVPITPGTKACKVTEWEKLRLT